MTAVGPFDTVMRIVVAAILGGLIGFERERHERPAGLRTHMLVSMGSCLLMITSVEVFFMYRHLTEPDPGRIAAQVVSGIGFLGAGTILREGVTVRGLTTAASLWVVAALGLAIGIGLFVPALTVTILALGTLAYLSRIEPQLFAGRSQRRFSLVVEDRPGMIGEVGSVLGQQGVDIKGIELRQADQEGDVVLVLTVFLPRRLALDSLAADVVKIPGIRKYWAG